MELTKDKDSDKCYSAEEDSTGMVCGVWRTQHICCLWLLRRKWKCLKQLLTGSGHKSAIIKSIVESEEIEFYWVITQVDFDVGDEETYKLLLHKTVELYVTVRGHLYAK